MKVEEQTKRLYAGLAGVSLIMLANFYLYVSGGPCEGSIDCTHISYPNGTIATVPAGQIPLVTRNPHPLLIMDLSLGGLAWALLTVKIARSLKENKDSYPEAVPTEEG